MSSILVIPMMNIHIPFYDGRLIDLIISDLTMGTLSEMLSILP